MAIVCNSGDLNSGNFIALLPSIYQGCQQDGYCINAFFSFRLFRFGRFFMRNMSGRSLFGGPFTTIVWKVVIIIIVLIPKGIIGIVVIISPFFFFGKKA
jgi:hypothetical protein